MGGPEQEAGIWFLSVKASVCPAEFGLHGQSMAVSEQSESGDVMSRKADNWVSPLVKCPTLGFRSGHDLLVLEFEPRVGLCADGVEPVWGSLSPPLSLLLSLLPCLLSLSKKNKY